MPPTMVISAARHSQASHARLCGSNSDVDISKAPSKSFHRRNIEIRMLAHTALGPALRHRFDLRPEAHTFRSMLVDVAEGGTLPAAEGVIGERHGNWNVDADHADIH